MPQVTLPTIAVNGLPLSGDAASRALYDIEGQTDNVLGQVNGFLDLTNLMPWETIGQGEIGHRQLTQGVLRARTVNCDYFEDVFPANDLMDLNVRTAQAQPVPGCGIKFYISKEARAVTFFWHVSAMTVEENVSPQLSAKTDPTFLMPFLDGVAQRRLERRCGGTRWAALRPGSERSGVFLGSRFWTGHWTYEPGMSSSGLWARATTGLPGPTDYKPTDVGWHSFGVRVTTVAKQVRIRTARIGYMAMF